VYMKARRSLAALLCASASVAAVADSSTNSSCYTQLLAKRSAPVVQDPPPPWDRLPQPVSQAEFAANGAAWLLTEGALLCCPSAADLTKCVHMRDAAAPAIVRTAANAGVLVSAGGGAVAVAKCAAGVSCSCTWVDASPRDDLGRVNDVALLPSGRAYVAAAGGFFQTKTTTGPQQQQQQLELERVAGLPAHQEFVAVAVASPPSPPSSSAVCLAVASAGGTNASSGAPLGAVYMRRNCSVGGGGGGGAWRHEWARGFFGENLTATSLSFGGGGALWAGGAQALHRIDSATGVWTRVQGREGLPAKRIQSISSSGTALWLGTASGVALRLGGVGRDEEWRFLAGPRWLGSLGASSPVMHVSAQGASALVTTADGAVTLLTEVPCYSIDTKAAAIQAQWAHFAWHGLTSRVPLRAFGDIAAAAPLPDDNHGWSTGWRLIALALQHNATGGSAETTAAISSTIVAMHRLNYVTGCPGLPARTLAAPGENITNTHWGWNPSPTLEGWQFVGNTSSDELTGHLPGYTLALLLAGDALRPSERELLTELLSNITSRIVADGFLLLDVDGVTPTRWGNYAPASLNDDAAWCEERGVNSLQILCHLVCAHRITRRADFERAFYILVNEHGYADNILNQKITAPDDLGGNDDELTFVPYLALHYACNLPGADKATSAMCAAISKALQHSIRRAYSVLRHQESALWALIYATVEGASSAAVQAVEAGARSLQRYPLEMVDWPTDNSGRLDLPTDIDMAPFLNVSSVALPRDESDALEWGVSPFTRSAQGTGRQANDPVQFLLPFWLGRREQLF
jgi:hypothetical protein